MIIKLKWVVIFQAVAIVLLLALSVNLYYQHTKIKSGFNVNGLLSTRIYSGLLEPKSFLIVNFAPLKTELNEYIKSNDVNVSIYVENLRNGAYMGIDERTGFFPGSLNKLPIAILIMKQVEEGKLSMDTMLEIKDSDRTDSSGELYKTKDTSLPLEVVMEKMLKESDNTALRVLLRYIDLNDLQFMLDYYGLDISVDYGRDHVDLITPKAMSGLFLSLYFSTVLEPKNSEYLLSLPTETDFNIKEIAGINENVVIAHKFGVHYYSGNRYFHDCGIIYIDEKRVFYCIMTKDLEEDKAVATMGFALNRIYTYMKDTDSLLGSYRKNQQG